jgi:predicted nucleic acid-binding protein
MRVLDANLVTELFKANPRAVAWFNRLPADARNATATNTRFEVLKGRYASILTAADREELLLAQSRLAADDEQLQKLTVLPITGAAADHFDRLRQNRKLKQIGRPDLLIACIALAHGATLVTRNVKDFQTIPNLRVENRAD